MSAINDLIAQIENAELRARIQAEVDKMVKQKKFGLVFEEHLPECTPLYDIPVRRGALVAQKMANGKIGDLYRVLRISGDSAECQKKDADERTTFNVNDLVTVAEFGEAIYPYLKPLDSVCNAPDSDLWHTLIEADNYHALQLLEYLYAGKVDCIYIDPPYNTGARDWKYNNDYVDGADTYRHSKWLSFMEKRLKLAKKLLNPEDSVLIVTIDEKEYLHLGCLLEEIFPNARIQMVSSIINPAGVQRKGEFARVDEYIFYVRIGDAAPELLPLSDEWRRNAEDKRTTKTFWSTLMRTGTGSLRSDSPNLFYPIFVSQDGKKFLGVGDVVPLGVDRNTAIIPEGAVAIWPIRSNGQEGRWQHSRESLLQIQSKGYVKLGRFTENGMALSYLARGEISKVEDGTYQVVGYREDGSVITEGEHRHILAATQWHVSTHDASRHGSNLLKSIFGDKRFTFPKSLYAVHDAIMFHVANKPNALIVDFFAGSGTTLHAVNLLNAEDGGKRRCIIITNNEVSAEESKELASKGILPGEDKWNALGIARHVTWPRTVCSIKGVDVNGAPLSGTYIGSDQPMSEGFKANAAFFKLGFLDKTAVALGRQFKEMLPTLWMKAGAFGACPTLEGDTPDMMILPENKFAVLIEEIAYSAFEKEMAKHPEIETVYIVTDSQAGYKEMIKAFADKNTYQLYRDYLDNFRINTGR